MNEHFSSKTIATENLKLEHVPEEDDDWGEIEGFALSFNPEEKVNMTNPKKSVSQILEDNTDIPLVELRFLLFFEQRRWNHIGRVPDDEAVQGIRELIVRIRKILNKRFVQ